jgi:hypothetical protein
MQTDKPTGPPPPLPAALACPWLEANSLPAGNLFSSVPALSVLFILKQRLRETFVRFSGRRTGKPADPNSELPAAEQGIKAAHRRASSRIDKDAVCPAIVVILAAFEPAAVTAFLQGSSGKRR